MTFHSKFTKMLNLKDIEVSTLQSTLSGSKNMVELLPWSQQIRPLRVYFYTNFLAALPFQTGSPWNLLEAYGRKYTQINLKIAKILICIWTTYKGPSKPSAWIVLPVWWGILDAQELVLHGPPSNYLSLTAWEIVSLSQFKDSMAANRPEQSLIS